MQQICKFGNCNSDKINLLLSCSILYHTAQARSRQSYFYIFLCNNAKFDLNSFIILATYDRLDLTGQINSLFPFTLSPNGKKEETSGRATEHGSLFRDGQTRNRCHKNSIYTVDRNNNRKISIDCQVKIVQIHEESGSKDKLSNFQVPASIFWTGTKKDILSRDVLSLSF